MIRLTSIDKTYQVGGAPLHALRQVDLTIDAGQYVAITGPSGSGKSTLLNMIGLLDRPDHGSYELNGTATEMLSEEARAALRRTHIGFIFQAFHLIPRLSAYENIELPLMLSGIGMTERHQRIQRVLEQMNMAEHAAQRPGELSGGQIQRIAIARAIVMQPRLLLADEPTGNLDQASGRDVVGLLEQLNQQGITVLMVTHNNDLAKRCGRRLQLVDGQITGDTSSCR